MGDVGSAEVVGGEVRCLGSCVGEVSVVWRGGGRCRGEGTVLSLDVL